ncbi:extensin-like [Helianthus annuus]|uniref:extensin-like n=1 Tax=Helianthus annuus TaxID=4232 RepID=UPI000B8EF869|nr:extensin-like [Helianthus annuus]
MPPRVQGKGMGPMRGGPSGHAGPSHRRTPSASFSSSDSHWGHSFEPARHSVSLSSSPSFHPSFGLLIPDEPQHSHHSHDSHHSHHSHQSYHSLHSHSFHHSDSTYSPAPFNPNDYVSDFLGYNPLRPEDHFSQEIEMNDDLDPEPPTGTPGHPISISSGPPYQGSPYQGLDSWAERWNQLEWAFTLSFHNSVAQPPLEEPHLQAVSTPPLPVEEPPQQPPQPPPEPPRRRRNARMSMQGGPRFSSPQGSSSYPPIPEDPQMGGPSHMVPEDNHPPVSFAPPPPPVDFENPIPTYPGSSGYNPFEYPTSTGYGAQDPYLTAAQYNALYPSSYPPVYRTGYPVQGTQIMAGSDEANSHPVEGNNNTRINVIAAELQEMINTAVAQAVDNKFKEPSNVRSKTHTKSLSHSHTPKKDESQHSSNQKSEPQRQAIYNQAPKYNKGCTYKYFVSCKPRDFTGEKGSN